MNKNEKEIKQEDQLEEEKSTATEEENVKEEVDETVEKVAELEEKIEEAEDQNLRLQAEIQNMRRRNQKDKEIATRYRSQDLAKEILPVIDNLERAMETEATDEASKSLKDGIAMVLESFKRALNAAGVEEVEAKNQPFDPNFHEAYAQVPAQDGQDSGVVAEVYEKGYKLHDRVLRAAKVTVTE